MWLIPSVRAVSERETRHLAARAAIGQVEHKLKVPSWHSPEFLGDQLASGDEGNTAGPVTKEEHPANAASSAHALEEFAPREGSETRDAGHEIVSDRSLNLEKQSFAVGKVVFLHGEGLW